MNHFSKSSFWSRITPVLKKLSNWLYLFTLSAKVFKVFNFTPRHNWRIKSLFKIWIWSLGTWPTSRSALRTWLLSPELREQQMSWPELPLINQTKRYFYLQQIQLKIRQMIWLTLIWENSYWRFLLIKILWMYPHCSWCTFPCSCPLNYRLLPLQAHCNNRFSYNLHNKFNSSRQISLPVNS